MSTESSVSIVAFMAVHNRRAATIRCINALLTQEGNFRFTDIVVVDDGSTDGTAEALDRFGDRVTVVLGDGSLYWAGGMALAESIALKLGADALLWVNDDAILDPNAIQDCVETLKSGGTESTIVCGTMVDSSRREVTYSGLHRTSNLYLKLTRRKLSPNATTVDTFNGNLVLVPTSVAKRMGGIDPSFGHHYADWDYGLRASKCGVQLLCAPGAQGVTDRNSVEGTFADRRLSRLDRLKRLFDVKGLPPRAHATMLRRHAGPLWAPQLVWGYLSNVALALRNQ
jgi:GT2 family glycosyltransferase